jgi:hypothetical protein
MGSVLYMSPGAGTSKALRCESLWEVSRAEACGDACVGLTRRSVKSSPGGRGGRMTVDCGLRGGEGR